MVLIVYANHTALVQQPNIMKNMAYANQQANAFAAYVLRVSAIQRFMSRKFAKYEIFFRSFNTEVTAEEEKLPKLGTLVPSMQAHHISDVLLD